MVRLQIHLNEGDFRMLADLASQEYRDPRQQAGILIREALQRRGLLESDETSTLNDPSGKVTINA